MKYQEEYRDRNWQRSEGRFAEKQTRENQFLEGYQTSPGEGYEAKRPRQLMNMESSYGSYSMGMSDKSKLVLLVREKRRHNSRGLAYEEKNYLEVNSQREHFGFYTNGHSDERSAFAYRKDIDDIKKLKDIFSSLERFLQEIASEPAHEVLPFTDKTYEENPRIRTEKMQMQKKFFDSVKKGYQKAIKRKLLLEEGVRNNMFLTDEIEQQEPDEEGEDEKKFD